MSSQRFWLISRNSKSRCRARGVAQYCSVALSLSVLLCYCTLLPSRDVSLSAALSLRRKLIEEGLVTGCCKHYNSMVDQYGHAEMSQHLQEQHTQGVGQLVCAMYRCCRCYCFCCYCCCAHTVLVLSPCCCCSHCAAAIVAHTALLLLLSLLLPLMLSLWWWWCCCSHHVVYRWKTEAAMIGAHVSQEEVTAHMRQHNRTKAVTMIKGFLKTRL